MEMTGAEMRTLREALGLPVTWLAEQTGVQERTIRHWETGRNKVPADVAKLLRSIDANIETTVSQAVLQYVDGALTTNGAPEVVCLVRYRTDADLHTYQPGFAPLPATCHGVLLHRTLKALEARKANVRIVYLDPHAYKQWLAKNNLEDGPAARAAWSTAQV